MLHVCVLAAPLCANKLLSERVFPARWLRSCWLYCVHGMYRVGCVVAILLLLLLLKLFAVVMANVDFAARVSQNNDCINQYCVRCFQLALCGADLCARRELITILCAPVAIMNTQTAATWSAENGYQQRRNHFNPSSAIILSFIVWRERSAHNYLLSFVQIALFWLNK